MPRLILVSCFASLSLMGACVDTSQPAKLAECAKTHSCSGPGGSSGGGGGGMTGTGGATGGQGGGAGSGGQTAGTGGGTTGSGGGTAGSGGGTGGSAGGTAGSGGGTAGNGGGAGGSSGGGGGGTDAGVAGSGGGGSSGSSDAGLDAPYLSPETEYPSDSKPSQPDVQQDVAVDAPIPGAETGGSEAGPDTLPDIAPDLVVDLMPDILTPRPDAGLDAGSCIQRFQANGYSLGMDASIAACSSCKDSGGNSLESTCKTMIDCLQPAWPCLTSGNCWRDCRNDAHADSVAESCVVTLTSAACSAH